MFNISNFLVQTLKFIYFSQNCLSFLSKHCDKKKLGLEQFPWIKKSLCFLILIRENILDFRMNSGKLKTKLDSVVLEK